MALIMKTYIDAKVQTGIRLEGVCRLNAAGVYPSRVHTNNNNKSQSPWLTPAL